VTALSVARNIPLETVSSWFLYNYIGKYHCTPPSVVAIPYGCDNINL